MPFCLALARPALFVAPFAPLWPTGMLIMLLRQAFVSCPFIIVMAFLGSDEVGAWAKWRNRVYLGFVLARLFPGPKIYR